MTNYVGEAENSESYSGLVFWIKNEMCYTDIAPLEKDLITASESQACAERVFLLCGDMCTGKKNYYCTSTNLEKQFLFK